MHPRTTELLHHLAAQREILRRAYDAAPPNLRELRPTPDRWSIAGVIEHFPRTTHLLTWDDNWSPARNRYAREYYAHPWMVNRDDLPDLGRDAR